MQRCSVIVVTFFLAVAAYVPAVSQENLTIEYLLTNEWKIAGYAASGDRRSTFILFRHAKHMYLVNCRVGYDVTRKPRNFVKCFELR